MHKTCLFTLLSLFTLNLFAQLSSAEEYINNYKELAIREMKRMGVPASITLAQGILETESGNSDLVRKSNNHFGIKCKSSWSGGSVSHDDDAFGECFRKYNTAEDSYRDHSNFLRGNGRYAPLFKLDPADYKGWAHGLKKAGYATNPAYPAILIRNIEKYDLHQYTLLALGEVPVFKSEEYDDDKSVVVNEPGELGNVATEEVVSPGRSKFNGLRAVYAAAGTSLLAIATQHKIDLDRLMEFNDMTKDGLLEEDGWIFLEKKAVNGNRDIYTVATGETLHSISQASGMQLASILRYNDLQASDVVRPGTKLRLRATVKDAGSVMSRTVNGKFHEVQPKEGLYSISKKYQVSIDQLREWNNLNSDDLRIGQKLIVSK